MLSESVCICLHLSVSVDHSGTRRAIVKHASFSTHTPIELHLICITFVFQDCSSPPNGVVHEDGLCHDGSEDSRLHLSCFRSKYTTVSHTDTHILRIHSLGIRDFRSMQEKLAKTDDCTESNIQYIRSIYYISNLRYIYRLLLGL